VTRVATEDNFSDQLTNQFKNNQSALLVAAAVLASLGVLPGMPHLVFLGFAAFFCWPVLVAEKADRAKRCCGRSGTGHS